MNARKTVKHKGVNIRPRGGAWQVDFGTRDGKRIQRSFSTVADAKLAIDGFKEESALEAIDQKNRRVAIYDLTDRERMTVISVRDKLGGTLEPLEGIVDHYLKVMNPAGGRRTEQKGSQKGSVRTSYHSDLMDWCRHVDV